MRGLLGKSLLALLLCTSVAFGQSISPEGVVLPNPIPGMYNFTGGGARAAGMGGAYIGIADDAAAISWNPAGLYTTDNPFDSPVLSLSYKRYSPEGDFSLLGVQGDQHFTGDDLFKGVDMVSFLAPMRIKGHPFVFGLAYTRLDDEFSFSAWTFDTTVQWTPGDIETGVSWPASEDAYSVYHAALNAVNIGFGTRLKQNVSFGLSINSYSGKSVYDTYDHVVIDSFPDPSGSLQRQTLTQNVHWNDTAKYSGVTFTFGLKYTGERFSAGLIVKTPHALKQLTDIKVDSVTMLGPNSTPPGQGFGTDTYFYDDYLIEVDMPMVIGAGFGVKASEKLLFSADVEYRPFGGGKVRFRDSLQIIPGDQDQEFFHEVDPLWNDAFTFRLGSEYLWSTGSSLLPLVPLRAGFASVPAATPNVEGVNVMTGMWETSTATATSFSLGTGVHWDQIHLDLAFVSSQLDQHVVEFLPIIGEYRWVTSDISTTSRTMMLTFTGYF